MALLPIQRLTLWKQGFGYYERRGRITEREISLIVPRAATNDVLKSLNIVVHEGGQFISVDYETPEDKQQVLSDLSVKLRDRSSLVDLLVSLRGSQVTLLLQEDRSASGRLIGVEASTGEAPVVIIQQTGSEERDISIFPLTELEGVRLLDSRAATDIGFFLDVSRVEQTRTTLTVRVSEGEHDIGLSYLAPSPVWRMSYRLSRISDNEVMLTAWGVFENSLDEDLVDVSLTLISGRPISFVYDLYESRVPTRPEVSDDTSVVEQMAGDPHVVEAMYTITHDLRSPLSVMLGFTDVLLSESSLTEQQRKAVQAIQESANRMNTLLGDLLSMVRLRDEGSSDHSRVASAYQAGPLGNLKVSGQYFVPLLMSNAETEYMTYRVDNPITVRRGQSAIVPIINTPVTYQSLIVFNGDKMPNHPLRVWELTNTTGYALEQGPVTIIDDGYVGEGLMRFAGVDDNIQIPYALEFGILVDEDVERSDAELYSVEIDSERRQVVVQRLHITTHTYILISRVEREMVVLIERRDPTRDEYYEMPEPIFSGAGHTRWAVEVPGNSTVTFPVKVRSLYETRESVKNWRTEFIDDLYSLGFLSGPLYTNLQALMESKQQAAGAVEEIKSLQAEQDRIKALQDQLRKNLGALGDSTREASIRDQLLTDLENSENRRRAIEGRTSELEQQVEAENRRQQTLLDEIYSTG